MRGSGHGRRIWVRSGDRRRHARTIAVENGLRVTSTVPLLCDAIRAKMLTVAMVEHVADQLLEGDYYLPFGPGGFRHHVVENGLLDYDEI
jgi:hypothetical protein